MVNKTVESEVDPRRWIASVEPERRRRDAEMLLPWFENVTNMPARMWGKDMIGFGQYHYRYESGREGNWFMTGFSPRKAAVSIYIMPGYQDLSEPLSRLGPHRSGKSCLYVTRLDAIDLSVLEEMVISGIANLRTLYQTTDG